MKKNIQTFLLFIIFSLCSISLFLVLKETEKEKTAGSEITTVGFEYTIKEYKGKIAVFNYGEDLPIEILDCPLRSLPETEADKIRMGINIENEINLQKIIEAYD